MLLLPGTENPDLIKVTFRLIGEFNRHEIYCAYNSVCLVDPYVNSFKPSHHDLGFMALIGALDKAALPVNIAQKRDEYPLPDTSAELSLTDIAILFNCLSAVAEHTEDDVSWYMGSGDISNASSRLNLGRFASYIVENSDTPPGIPHIPAYELKKTRKQPVGFNKD